MAHLVGCVAMSHGPQLMLNPDQWDLLKNRESEGLPDKPGLENETAEVKWTKWRGCMDAIATLRQKLNELRPDVVIVVGDDQHENLVDDNMPPFTIYMGGNSRGECQLEIPKAAEV